MNIEDIIKENQLLKSEIEKLTKKLENYNNSRKSYYEKNKDVIKEKAKERTKQIIKSNPEKIKEYAKRAYQKQKEKRLKSDMIIEDESNIDTSVL